MLILAALVLVVAVAAAAMLVAMAAGAAERAVRLTAAERRREHLRRLGEAAADAQAAADAYLRAMRAALERNGGDDEAALRAHAVRHAASGYREACRRLRRALAGGPRPRGLGRALVLLTNERAPEAVAAARPADLVLEEVADLQDALDAALPAEDRSSALWRARASLRLALLSLRGRLRGA